jgi:transposase
MSLKFKPSMRVFVFSEHVDLRAGFDRLQFFVENRMGRKVIDGDLFLFFGKSKKKMKAICYDGTGLLLIAKRMERGRFMNLSELEEKEITTEELDSLLRGGIIRRPVFGRMPQSLTNLPISDQTFFR